MKISDIMTTSITVAEPDTTIEEIACMMKEQDVGVIPVVDDDQMLSGVITDRDIVLRCIAEGEDPSECVASDILSSELEVISPDSSLEQAARLMADRQIRRLPVVEDGRLVGIVSLGDVAVKAHDDDLSGDTLEDVSKGVKQESGKKQKLQPSAPAGRPSTQPRETGQTATAGNPQQGASRGGLKTTKFRPQKQEPELREASHPQGLASDSSPRKQGISSHSAQQENKRQSKVVPFRNENEVRNTKVAKPAYSGKSEQRSGKPSAGKAGRGSRRRA